MFFLSSFILKICSCYLCFYKAFSVQKYDDKVCYTSGTSSYQYLDVVASGNAFARKVYNYQDKSCQSFIYTSSSLENVLDICLSGKSMYQVSNSLSSLTQSYIHDFDGIITS